MSVSCDAGSTLKVLHADVQVVLKVFLLTMSEMRQFAIHHKNQPSGVEAHAAFKQTLNTGHTGLHMNLSVGNLSLLLNI